jgi:hypothetical protein
MSELSYEELLCVKSFIDWRNEVKPEIIATETTIFSEIHGYAGTVDCVARINGIPCVIDFKTSKNVWKEYELQVSAYRMALENGENPIYKKNPNGTDSNELVDLSGLKMAILQVGYDKNKDGYKFTEIDDAFPLFKVAQQIWREEHTSKKTGDMLTPGFTKRDFPIVLSPAAKIGDDAPVEPQPEKEIDPEFEAKKVTKSKK